MQELISRLEALRLVPVVKIDKAEDAGALCDALCAGGLPCAEITFRTSAAVEALGIAAARGDMLVGAGTVLSVDQVKQAVDHGASFIVSPGFNPKVVSYCVENGIPITPGTSNPTDIEMALEFGLEVVKFFPAEAFGGLKTLKAVSAPYGMMRFIPTGGINPRNLADYLRFDKVVACGGSWMVTGDLLADKKFSEIERLTREAVELAEKA
jgi:2-dehydro-3-deoxyphosphogluconate aldolase/(4S)-4-hydroxy-2-oxoglutarate aldolase